MRLLYSLLFVVACSAAAASPAPSVTINKEQQKLLSDASAKLQQCSIETLGAQQHGMLQMQLAYAYVMAAPKISQACAAKDYEAVRATMVATNSKPAVSTFLEAQQNCYFKIKDQVTDKGLLQQLKAQFQQLGINETAGEYKSLKTLDIGKLCAMLKTN